MADAATQRPSSKLGMIIIVTVWILAAIATGYVSSKMWPSFQHRMRADAPG